MQVGLRLYFLFSCIVVLLLPPTQCNLFRLLPTPAQFGEVSRGRYRPLGRREVLVAVKTLRWGASDRERGMFLSEAGVLGQFDHPNVLKLEGVITRSPPERIITEFMENGPLDSFLRVRRQHAVYIFGMLLVSAHMFHFTINQRISLRSPALMTPSGERGPVQRPPAGWDAQRNRCRDALPL